MKKLITLFLFFSSVAYAGLYECKSSDSKPKLIENPVEKKISFETAEPYFHPNALHPFMHSKNLKPYMIYYAIDSSEPFMQYSVKYEIAKLKEACERSDKVNFVAILNSLYVDKNEIIVCKNKTYSNVKLNTFPKLDQLLKAKRNFLFEGDHTKELPGMMTYLVRYKKVVNEAFYNFPLAHPDFLFDLINLVKSEKSLFHVDEYMPFLNLKSHGSRQNVLSGLHECQIQAKTMSQNAYLDKLNLPSSERMLLEQKNYSFILPQVEKVLEKLALSETIGVGGKDSLGREFMGKEFMGKEFMGKEFMGEAIAGLGNSEGMGADYSFGTYHIALSSVLIHLFNDFDIPTKEEEDRARFLGFVMLESCDTNRNVKFHQEALELVLGSYSARHSLWYRNLNWWAIMEEANGSTEEMIRLLQHYTPMIKNIIVTE